mmetsp:Transcript_22139/g.41182  ORF Transcript_22139/g.41182 Transcript_22139/m.41182 type:complete len:297 (+) Transcript_22139:653-1543(+)
MSHSKPQKFTALDIEVQPCGTAMARRLFAVARTSVVDAGGFRTLSAFCLEVAAKQLYGMAADTEDVRYGGAPSVADAGSHLHGQLLLADWACHLCRAHFKASLRLLNREICRLPASTADHLETQHTRYQCGQSLQFKSQEPYFQTHASHLTGAESSRSSRRRLSSSLLLRSRTSLFSLLLIHSHFRLLSFAHREIATGFETLGTIPRSAPIANSFCDELPSALSVGLTSVCHECGLKLGLLLACPRVGLCSCPCLGSMSCSFPPCGLRALGLLSFCLQSFSLSLCSLRPRGCDLHL